MTNDFYSECGFESKQTEMFGNVQLGQYYTDDIEQIRKDFDKCFNSLSWVENYFFIVHDTNEGQDSEYIHVHFILQLRGQVRCSTMCNKLSEMLNVNTLAISIGKLKTIVQALKYFLHITDKAHTDGKKLYAEYEIISNCNPLVVHAYLESDTANSISINVIKELVIECSLKSDVITKLGNRKIIKENRYFIDTFWADKDMLTLRQREIDDLPF